MAGTPPISDWPNVRAAIVHHFDPHQKGWLLTGMAGVDPSGPQFAHLIGANPTTYRWVWLYLLTSNDPCGVLFAPGATHLTQASIVYGNCMDSGQAAAGAAPRRPCSC